MTRADEVRPAERMPVPRGWFATRPGEVWLEGPPTGKRFGAPGPDQGYGVKLARLFEDRLRLVPPEQADGVVSGCSAVGDKRAARFGRAPVIHDFELAFTVWGFLGEAPAGLVEFRKPLFLAAAHDYWAQRAIADAVPDETLQLTAADVAGRLSEWRTFITTSSVR
jgi:hypothetical protein